jgi:hypothetical protein
MNTLDRPDLSDRTKILAAASLITAFAVLIGSFWFAMKAIHQNNLGPYAVIGASLIYVVLVIVIVRVFRRAWRAFGGAPPTSALSRRDRRIRAGATVYVIFLMAVTWVHLLHPVQGALAYALALLPALPVVYMVVAVGLYFREETDEFERSVRIENALWATGVVMAVSTVWGFAELLAGAPHLQNWLWFPLWTGIGSTADFFIRRRFR